MVHRLECISKFKTPGSRFTPLHLIYFCAFVYSVFFYLSVSLATEIIIVSVTLNQEKKGEFFVISTDHRDFLIKTSDLKGMGFREPDGIFQKVSGEEYISLNSMQGVEFTFNEKNMSLEITASPVLLSKKVIDFKPHRRINVYYPKDSSAFLNYRLEYSGGSPGGFKSFNVTNQLGIRTGDILFLSDSSYTKTPADEKFVRLMSNITYDRRKEMQRIVVGDFFASSGSLGSSVNLGGFSLSKIYQMDPYFIRYPTADFSGVVSLPSDMEIYLNGTQIGTERLSPGEFDLENISYYGGASVIEVVIKDLFGKAQRFRYPFYFTDTLLKRGLHEYSYNIGFLREEFGVESNRYSNLVFSAFHRYGRSDSLNLGLRAEGGRGRYNLGSQASYLIAKAGVITLSLSGSYDTIGKTGFAGLLSYGYQDRKINAQFFLKRFTADYITIGEESRTERTKYEAGMGMGYGTKDRGSISLNFNTIKKYQGLNRQTVSATYSRSLYNKFAIFLTARNIKEKESDSEIFVGINYYPWKDISISTRYEKSKDTAREVLQVQKNPPQGEGYGYRASVESANSQITSANTLNAYLQYNSGYGIYTGEFSGQSSEGRTSENYRLSASGGIAYLSNIVGFSRPITDSFGLVKVGELKGVRVYQNNQEIGRTDSSGKIFVPNLNSYYENQVSIDDKDIPIDYSISEVTRYISPPLRSGTFIKFETKKIQGVTGMLKMKMNGDVMPLEFYEVRVTADDKEITFPTGKGGEFYIEDIGQGTYKASFDYKEKTCFFDIIVPESEDMIIDLGEIVCEYCL